VREFKNSINLGKLGLRKLTSGYNGLRILPVWIDALKCMTWKRWVIPAAVECQRPAEGRQISKKRNLPEERNNRARN
jgi:hypothetical protein